MIAVLGALGYVTLQSYSKFLPLHSYMSKKTLLIVLLVTEVLNEELKMLFRLGFKFEGLHGLAHLPTGRQPAACQEPYLSYLLSQRQ